MREHVLDDINTASAAANTIYAAATPVTQRFIVASQSPPALSISKTHVGSFSQGQEGATYTITVSNAAGDGLTSGTVTVTDILPSGLTLSLMSGNDWSCSGDTCTRSDVLAPGSSYPAILAAVTRQSASSCDALAASSIAR